MTNQYQELLTLEEMYKGISFDFDGRAVEITHRREPAGDDVALRDIPFVLMVSSGGKSFTFARLPGDMRKVMDIYETISMVMAILGVTVTSIEGDKNNGTI
jgi:hypothetical protein